MTRHAGIACATLALILGATVVQAHATPRRVLLLYSYEREFSHFTFARMFRPELTRSSPDPIDFIEISLQTVRASRTDSDQTILDDLRGEVGSRPFDLVVTIGGPAASFAHKHRGEIFPQAPVLLTAADSRFLQTDRLPEGETAVLVRNDPLLMLESMLRLLPDTKTVVVVIGASQMEEFWLKEVQKVFRPFEARVNFIWTNQLSFATLLERSGSLPPHSAIFYGIYSLDANGVPQMEDQTLDALHAAANAPMFGLHSHQMGHGIIGGPLLSLDDLSRDAAATALRLLRGDPANSIAPRTLLAGTATFDARELRRWHIPESRLQPGSLVRFREAAASRRDNAVLGAVIAFVTAQTLLVIGLAISTMRRRQAAPRDMADVTAAEAALARLSQRLMQAQEQERAWIAKAIHDDVCQQLLCLTIRLHALGATPGEAESDLRTRIRELCDQFSALEHEILAISDPLYARLQMLGLAVSARSFCERRCAEHAIDLQFRAAIATPDLPDAVPLAIFRVLQEAIENVLAHASASRVTVSLSERNRGIELEVADNGVGFDPDQAMRGTAVGLIAIRERLRPVGGTCAFHSRPGAGTRILARVPV
jgi:signal transduction histidine kinase